MPPGDYGDPISPRTPPVDGPMANSYYPGRRYVLSQPVPAANTALSTAPMLLHIMAVAGRQRDRVDICELLAELLELLRTRTSLIRNSILLHPFSSCSNGSLLIFFPALSHVWG